MKLELILNDILNKAMIGNERIKQVNSNEIARFVDEYMDKLKKK